MKLNPSERRHALYLGGFVVCLLALVSCVTVTPRYPACGEQHTTPHREWAHPDMNAPAVLVMS